MFSHSLCSLLVIFLVECMSGCFALHRTYPLTVRRVQTFRPPMWITSSPTRLRHLRQRSSVSLTDPSFLVIARTSLHMIAVQLPLASSPPGLPARQAVVSEATPLLDPCPSEFTAPPRRHTFTGGHNHGLMLGHHRHEPPQQHERHHTDHPRSGLMQYLGPEEDRGEEASPTRHQHVADHRQSRHLHSHALVHAHHSGDIEGLVDRPDSDAEINSAADDAELKIGRKRQIIGILVRLMASSFTR